MVNVSEKRIILSYKLIIGLQIRTIKRKDNFLKLGNFELLHQKHYSYCLFLALLGAFVYFFKERRWK